LTNGVNCDFSGKKGRFCFYCVQNDFECSHSGKHVKRLRIHSQAILTYLTNSKKKVIKSFSNKIYLGRKKKKKSIDIEGEFDRMGRDESQRY
jgi:hypothetical protein